MNEQPIKKGKDMGTIINGTLKNKESWYRPLFFCTMEKDYEISGFVVYDADRQEIMAELNQGWINDNNIECPIELERKSSVTLASQKPYFIPCKDKSRTALDGKSTYTIYVPVGKFAEMGEQRLVETKYPGMGLMVQNMAKVIIFGQKTGICLSSELKYYQFFQKRKKICATTGITDFDLRKVLEQIKENGYSIDELLEDK